MIKRRTDTDEEIQRREMTDRERQSSILDTIDANAYIEGNYVGEAENAQA